MAGASMDLIVKTAAMGKRIGMGHSPVLLIIDMQVYMMGDQRQNIEHSIQTYPSSCGEKAWDAAEHIQQLIREFRARHFPVVYTQQSLKPDGSNAGPYKGKRSFLYGADNWLIEGTHGWEISPLLQPEPGEIVLRKTRPSAFFGTDLRTVLEKLQADTIVVTGGSTSTCVRATVFDCASYDYHTIVVSDGVCDRSEESHRVNLADMDRQMADVMTTEAIIAALPK
ncbi:MAG: cysteine hydrolase family protein [Lawsonibacter sp.]